MNNLIDKKILVTGAAGFIGSNIIDALVAMGCKSVSAFDDFSTGQLVNIQHHVDSGAVRLIEGSITNYDLCEEATRNIDIVLHQAALGSVPRSIENPINTHNVNVNGFINILEAARKNKVARVVYASSSSVYGDNSDLPKIEHLTGNPLSPYAVSKKTNELYAKVYNDLYNLETIGLRYFNVFGPKQSPEGPYAAVIPIFIHNLLNNKPCFIFGDGNNRRDFTYVENVVQANILAATTEGKDVTGQVYNIGYGDTKTINRLYEMIKEGLKSDREPEYKPTRQGEIKDSFASITKAKEKLGYEPKIDLATGIQLSINWYKNNLR